MIELLEGEPGFISVSKEAANEPKIHGLIATGMGNEAVTIDDPSTGQIFRLYEKYEVENGFADELGKLLTQAQAKYDSRQSDAQYNVTLSKDMDSLPGTEISLECQGAYPVTLRIAKITSDSDSMTELELGPKSIAFIDIENARSGVPAGGRDKSFRESHEPISVSDTAHVMDPKHFYSDISTITYRYKCISNHDASLTSEPGVGASWATYWEKIEASVDIGNANIDDWVSGKTYDTDYAGTKYDSYCYNSPNVAVDAVEDVADPLHAILAFAIPPGVLAAKIIPRVTLSLSISLVDIAPQWVTGTIYAAGIYTKNIPEHTDEDAENYMVSIVYLCKTGHTAGSTTEPGVGASWATYWTEMDASLDLDLGRCGIKTLIDGDPVPGMCWPSTVIGSSNGLPDADVTDYIEAGKSIDVEVFVMLQNEYSNAHTDYKAQPVYTASGTMKFYSRGAIPESS
jgi:hypothetical protein